MAVVFSAPTRQGTITFLPGPSLGFDDPNAEPFFIAAGWAAATNDPPVMTYSVGEVSVDPGTVFGHGPNIGQPVIPEPVQEA